MTTNMTIIEELLKEINNLNKEIRKIEPPRKRVKLFLSLERITTLVDKAFIAFASDNTEE